MFPILLDDAHCHQLRHRWCDSLRSAHGRGRALDNVFIERLWRTVKYEEVYLQDYADGWEAEVSLWSYFTFYCHERTHQSLGYRTPAEVYGAADSSRHRHQDEK